LHGHSLLVVDYAQLVSHKAESETVRIGEISRGFKELAQDLDIPVILISQLNRESDKRGGDGRPRLVDLRGSGSLEQDASEVVFLHDEGANDPAKATPFTELIIAQEPSRQTQSGVAAAEAAGSGAFRDALTSVSFQTTGEGSNQ
jgi:replicative DNA helicase